MLFQTRFALSFLRGPMTRDQVAQLMEAQKKHPPVPPQPDAAHKADDREFRASLRPKPAGPSGVPLNHVPPGLPADVNQVYLPTTVTSPAPNTPLLYQPRLLACAEPGLPCLTRSTYDLVEGAFRFRSEQPRTVTPAGLDPCEVWDVVGRR